MTPPRILSKTKMGFTAGMFRSYDLRVMSPTRIPLRHDGEGLLQCLDAPMRFVIIPATCFVQVTSEL